MQHYSGVIILDGPMGSHLEGLQYELWVPIAKNDHSRSVLSIAI